MARTLETEEMMANCPECNSTILQLNSSGPGQWFGFTCAKCGIKFMTNGYETYVRKEVQ